MFEKTTRYLIYIAVSILLSATSLSAQENTPGFDCNQAQSEAEKLVCSELQLALLDRELTRVYNMAFQDPSLGTREKKYLRASQRGWIKGRDEVWKVKDKKRYVRDVYLLRIAEILKGYPVARSNRGDGISKGPVGYTCDGAPAEAYFITTDPGSMILYFEESPFVLIQEKAGSGAKYTGKYAVGSVEFRAQGEEAVFTSLDGRKLQCYEQGT